MFHWNRSLLLLFYMLLLLALWLMGLHRVLRVNPRYFTGIPGHLFLPITRANTSLKIYQRWFGSFTLQGIHPRELYTPFLINELKMYWALFDSLGLKLNNTVFFFFLILLNPLRHAFSSHIHSGPELVHFEHPPMYVQLVILILEKGCETTGLLQMFPFSKLKT